MKGVNSTTPSPSSLEVPCSAVGHSGFPPASRSFPPSSSPPPGRPRPIYSAGAEDYRPQLRAGIHVGRPRRLGGDYLGVDVNIAARLVEQASGDELLVSGRTLEMLDTEDMKVRRKRRFKVKGVPDDVAAHSVSG